MAPCIGCALVHGALPEGPSGWDPHSGGPSPRGWGPGPPAPGAGAVAAPGGAAPAPAAALLGLVVLMQQLSCCTGADAAAELLHWGWCSGTALAGCAGAGAAPAGAGGALGQGPRAPHTIRGVSDGPTLWPQSAIPYNARAHNVRACLRARARGMNPPWEAESPFWALGACLPRPFGGPEGPSFGLC